MRPTPPWIMSLQRVERRGDSRRKGDHMGRAELEGVGLGTTWHSWVGSAHAVLRAAKLWDGETWELMGVSGFAFHFHVNPGVCPSSPTEFAWTDLPVSALDRLGLYSEATQRSHGMNTEQAALARAGERIRASIDRGVGVIVWAPTDVLEFGVVRGYDDADGAYLVTAYGPPSVDRDPLLYENLGRSEVPILFYQIIHQKVPVDSEQAYRQSLELGVQMWKPQPSHPGRGESAYGVMIDALERDDFIPFGVAYNLVVYGDAKQKAALYLEHLAELEIVRNLSPAHEGYSALAKRWKDASNLAPFMGPASRVDPARVPELVRVLKECHQLECDARRAIESALAA